MTEEKLYFLTVKQDAQDKLLYDKLIAELTKKKSLDVEVVQCINNNYDHYRHLEHFLKQDSMTNRWFRAFFCLDTDIKHEENIRLAAKIDNNDPEERVEKYRKWRESKRVSNLKMEMK